MKLGFLIEAIKDELVSIRFQNQSLSFVSSAVSNDCVFLNSDIQGISLHSKRLKKGSLFFCLSGAKHQGSDFIADAYSNGAIAAVVEENFNCSVPKDMVLITVKNIRACLGRALNTFFDFPLEKLNLTAVTGTNGKTTITYLLESVFRAHKTPSAVIGTVNYRLAGRSFRGDNTTPDIVTIFELLGRMVHENIRFLFMEVSSHSLAQDRIRGLRFNQAVFTNLTQDHLDYHATMRQYFDAKTVLFRRYLHEKGTAVINIDSPYGKKLAAIAKKAANVELVTYGIQGKALLRATGIRFHSEGTEATIHAGRRRFRLRTNLLGSFNLYNILASIGVALRLQVSCDVIAEGLRDVYVPGRLERIPAKRGLRIFVDYAHTEDALRNILLTLCGLKKKSKLIAVFGCGGDRDTTKRAAMGKVAAQLCDQVILTSDNPRSEDPQKIIDDIQRGIRTKNYLSVVDRKEAIKKAIAMAQNRDIIVVAGKGHEDYQIIKNEKTPFSDRRVIEDILAEEG